MRIASGSVTFTDGFFNSGVVEGRLTTNDQRRYHFDYLDA